MRALEHSLPLKLLMAREAVMERFRPHLLAAGVTEQQWRVLRALCEADEAEAGELAEAICLKMPSLSRILADLSGEGLINRRNGTEDRRLRLVSITEKGRALVAKMARHSEKEYAQIQNAVGAGAYAVLMNDLQATIDKLNSLNQPAPD
ncbi:MAG: homoprotocatechuate degradation operon regulator HpaR [Alphaproteobacteria bacterium]|nr:homoprotocatechuate degradation operon regulator HpaR [Alphaproteobacteria bacterium]